MFTIVVSRLIALVDRQRRARHATGSIGRLISHPRPDINQVADVARIARRDGDRTKVQAARTERRSEVSPMHTDETLESQRSSTDADCAWCHREFDSIVALLDHVDTNHLDRPVAA